MVILKNYFFQIAFFLGVLGFYGATFLRTLIIYLKTKINQYDYYEQKDKGFIILFAISIINLFFPEYVKYFGNLGFLFGIVINYIKTFGFLLVLLSIIFFVKAQDSLGDSWKIGLKKEQKTKLNKTGLYKYSRHPIYLAMLLFFFGLFLLLPTILMLFLLIGNSFVLILTAKKEEKYLVEEHGEDYKKYMNEVNFLIPKLRFSKH